MDIEGWEYRVLEQMLEFTDSVLGFVVELHDVDLHRDRISRFVTRSNGGYAICHVHANNYGPVDEHGDATVLEVTWVRRDLLDSPTSAGQLPASVLDFPNDPDRPEILVRFGPSDDASPDA
jgi:hypothetical protein